MAPKILAPVQKNDGASLFRIKAVAAHIDSTDLQVELYSLGINKFKSFPVASGVRIVDKLTGTAWDMLKLLQRRKIPRIQHRYDATWLSRSLLSFPNEVDRAMRRIIYDVDDAVWLGEGAHCFEHHCRSAIVVLAGNEFLAEKAAHYSSKVEVVPTSVETSRYVPINQSHNQFRVGWIGSASGFFYLKDIEKQLLAFFAKRRDAKLVVMAERFPSELDLLTDYIEFVPWSVERDVEIINTFSVGLMPLRDTDWDRGKCSFKMLQYMACGVPALVSAIGNNAKVLAHERHHGAFGTAVADDWDQALETLYLRSDADRRQVGRNGRRIVQEYYAADKIAPLISGLIKKHL
jgi:glycosyltransferase involved in cell wall biosynthesis